MHLSTVDVEDDYLDNDTYEYDYNASLDYFPLEKAVPMGILYGLLLLLGSTGNVLVIFSISRYKHMKNITNTFLLSLASADLLLLVFCVPIKFADFMTFTWQYGEGLCKGVHYIMDVSAICSVTTLTVMSMERYYAILHPMKAKYTCTAARAKKATLCVWFASFALAIPTLFIRYLLLVGREVKQYRCERWWGSSEAYHALYEIYMLLIILAIPVSVMVFAYTNICSELWTVTHQRLAMRKGERVDNTETCVNTTYNDAGIHNQQRLAAKRLKDKDEKRLVSEDNTRKQVIKMLILIILLFVVSWGPIIINNVLVAFGVVDLYNHGVLYPIRQTFYFLAYSNSCVNPIVYGFMSKNFRATFKRAICRCVKGRYYGRATFDGRSATRMTNASSSFPRSEMDRDFELQTNAPALEEHVCKSNDRETYCDISSH